VLPQSPPRKLSGAAAGLPELGRKTSDSLPAGLVRQLISAGYLSATSTAAKPGSARERRNLRIARALLQAGLSARAVIAGLRGVGQVVALSLSTTGDRASCGTQVVPARRAAEERAQQAQLHFDRAFSLEESDTAAALSGYQQVLRIHAGHLEARINLGRLLHLAGELEQAEKVYRTARHASALLSFNLALLLEDLNREAEAIIAYREALALDPSLHDAHFNLSRLHERAQRPREALRHLLAYRRHSRLSAHSTR
jgi:tetratricopeptide (TPR) repeat protein